jgi:hypothetical protein
MSDTPRSELVSLADARLMAVCENCGAESPSKPWPVGWTRTGRSMRRIIRERGTLMAWWCPSCEPKCFRNPSESQIKSKRKELVAGGGLSDDS